MSGRGFDEALENARLVIARIPTPGFVIALVVFGWFHSQAAGQGETIYDNTNSQNQFLPTSQIPPFNLEPPQEIIGRETSRGGDIISFQFGYFTPLPGPFAMTIRFYTGTEAGPSGTTIAEFPFTDLPGFDPKEEERFINHSVERPFPLPPGEFGVGIVNLDKDSGTILSTGGNSPNQLYIVSQDQNFILPDVHNAIHLRLVRRAPPSSLLPVDFEFNSPPLAQVGETYDGGIFIPPLDPQPVDPYFNMEFFIGIETGDDIEIRIPENPFNPNVFNITPIDPNTPVAELKRLRGKFGEDPINHCSEGVWKCGKIEFGDGFEFETEIFVDGFESGDVSSWSTGAAADNSEKKSKEVPVGVLNEDKKLPVITEEELRAAIELFNDDVVFDEKTIGLVSERFGVMEPLPPAKGTYFFDEFESFRSIAAAVGSVIDGSGCPAPCSGLVLEGGNGGINGIRIENFPDYGVEIHSDGNSITNTELVGNGSGGLRINGNNNVIGGETKNGNLVADNGGPGIVVESGSGNSVISARGTKGVSRFNSFSNNGGLGIDLGGDGVTPNDTADGDTGANNLQNFPELTTVTAGTQTRIRGTLSGVRNTRFTLQFFGSDSCDPSGNGEGETFLDSITEFTGSTSQTTFSLTSDSDSSIGQFITATATDGDGNTSEFSSCFAIETAFNPAWLFGAGTLEGAEGSTFDGVAVTNFSAAAAADLNLEAITADSSAGLLSTSTTQGGGGQQISLTLLAGEQRARLRSELFEGDATLPAWVELTGDTSNTGAFSQFGTLDGSQLDGGVAITEIAKSFNFTRVFQDRSPFREARGL